MKPPLLLPLALLAVGCAAPTAGTEKTDETHEPLGFGVPNIHCSALSPTTPNPPCITSLSWIRDASGVGGHVNFQWSSWGFGGGDNVIVSNQNVPGILQTGSAYGSYPGYDAYGLPPGAMYAFKAETCQHENYWFRCDQWSQWSVPGDIYVPDAGTHWMDTQFWLLQDTAQRVDPTQAWSGGWELTGNGTTRDLKVCSVQFVDGQHVGRWFDDGCHIGWGWGEHVLPNAMVLMNVDPNLAWEWNNVTNWQSQAVVGGWQNGPEYICRAWTQGFQGIHPGRVYDGACHVGWGNQELVFSQFQVLTRQ
jgi:hypothetical protein